MTECDELLRRALDLLIQEAADDVDPETVDELEERLRLQGWKV